MTRVVLSIGSNVGDRMARLQSVTDSLGDAVRAVSRVYETEPWGGVDQGPFLNAVLIADDPARDGHGWLRRAHELEEAAERVRGQRWGPRTLDVDLVSCYEAEPETAAETGPAGETEILSYDDGLTLPHPLAHLRAFVMVPWLAIEPDAELTVGGRKQPVAGLLAELEPADRAGVRLTDSVLDFDGLDRDSDDGRPGPAPEA
jgi:2-amino-4-hydroxy-6-hydroxymethyldihydropteridine diphosphokinase